MVTKEPTFFGAVNWIDVPFMNKTKTDLDLIIDDLLRLSQIREDIINDSNSATPVLEELQAIQRRLDQLYSRCRQELSKLSKHDDDNDPYLWVPRVFTYEQIPLNAIILSMVLGISNTLGQIVIKSRLAAIDPAVDNIRGVVDKHIAYIFSSAECSLSDSVPSRTQLYALLGISLVMSYCRHTSQLDKATHLIQQYQQKYEGRVWVSLGL